MRWLYLASKIGLIGYVLVVAALYLGQRRLLYVPGPGKPVLGDLAALGFRDVTLQTEDGLSLLSWYLPPPAGAPVIVYFHGNGGNIGDRTGRMRLFAGAGFGLLMAEYRGYGGNPGSPSEAGLLADGRAALSFLGQQSIPADRTVLYGESLGTGVAVQLAAHHPVAGLILEAPYTSIADAAQSHYPFVPARWLVRDRFDSLSAIGGVKAPILFLEAHDDQVIPARLGRALYDAAPEPKQMWVAPSGGHNDVGRFGGIDVAIAFVRRQVGVRVLGQGAR